MTNATPDPKHSPPKRNNPLILAGLAAGGFVVLLTVIIYLTSLLETVEDRLRYAAPTASPEQTIGIDIAKSQTVYVPVYSHIYSRGGDPFLLEVTLSLRNSDPERSINVNSVKYYDTKGKPVRDYLQGTLTLGPLETAEFLVEKTDTKGGSGSNFIVAWNADQPVYEPIIEAVMIGHDKGHSISFKSIGRPLSERAKLAAEQH